MRRLLSELNNFSESTTVHGFGYISRDKEISTRIIWSLIVLGAAVAAGFFLFRTVKGFDENYTSTTIKTKSIKEYPFPAVTFHPGDFNSEDAFTRIFFNQFQFTRYHENDPRRDNDLFMRKFRWIVSPMNKAIFEGLKKYLLDEKEFIKDKGIIFEKEVCGLVALNVTKVNVESIVIDEFAKNMYKIRGFSPVKRFLNENISKEINSLMDQYNISKNNVSTICKDPAVSILLTTYDLAG